MERDLAAEMAAPKYAQLERERRWLVDRDARPDVSGRESLLIEDLYLVDTRFRLRRMSRSGWSSCKLTKRYQAEDAAVRPIVTAYLSEAEFHIFRRLPGRAIVKRRYRVPLGKQTWSLDLFEGALAGLELVECESSDDRGLAGLVPPPWAEREITYDPDYQCGSLAHTNAIPENTWRVS
jgi:CYTH domain-containing protein